MKVVISSGHGKYVSGASGYINEVTEARKVVDRVADLLNTAGVQATKFHDDTSHSVNENLDTIVNFHNSKTRDLDVSVHFNAYQTTAKAMGTEVLYVSSSGLEAAKPVVNAIAAVGFINRGPKKRTDLAFLNGTEEPAILIETCFVDSQADVNLYHQKFEQTCKAIADSIAGEASQPEPGPEPPSEYTAAEEEIMRIAGDSEIASYNWKDRGVAPTGFTLGFALAWAQCVMRWQANDPVVREMGKANTHNDATDALSWYNSNFQALGMSNENSSIDTLRHLFVLLHGLAMRESSGKHCCGRDQSASNTDSNTCEAGLYQTSYNAHGCSPHFDTVMEQYEAMQLKGYMEAFAEDVSCSQADWQCYGTGRGFDFQLLCKEQPAFAVESCALVLRNLRQHYGPINRKEAELRADSDQMLLDVQRYVMEPEPAPEPEPAEVEVTIKTKGNVKVIVTQVEG
jgi:N-acetylmuramoyl-L-alanine amidase